MRKDLKSMAMAMGKIRNPITPPPGLEDKMREERRRERIINTDFGAKIEAIRGVNYTPDPNPEKNYEKGFEPFGPLSGQAKSLSSRKIKGVTVLGGNQPTKQSGLGAVVSFGKKKK